MTDPADLIRSEIRALAAYPVPDAEGFIKLDAMENPWPWPEAGRQAWLERLRQAELNRYPEPRPQRLMQRLRAVMGVPDGMAVLLGNGSDELIQILALAVLGQGRPLLSPEPGFVMYRMIATFCGLEHIAVPLRRDFSLDLPAMLEAIAEHRPAVVFLAYPNNPTGNLFDEADMEQILDATDGLVVVDEAYHAFSSRSFMPRLGEWDNLLVMRTVSKMGLAGIRLGLLAGPAQWIDELDKLRLPYNINTLTRLTAEFALEHHEVLDEQTRRIREERARLAEALSGLGLEVFPSEANFLLVRTAPGRATPLFEGLRARRILIKNLHAPGSLLEDCLRITVGTPEENAALVAALGELLAEG